MRISNSYSIL